VHGIDDLRALNNIMGRPIPAYAHHSVFDRIRSRFDYAFLDNRGQQGYWRPELTPHEITGPFHVGRAEILPFVQRHGRGESWGFRFGPFAYSTDCDHLDERAFELLAGIEIWLVDALRDRPHPSHAHLERTLGWIERVQPRQAYLTHTNHEVDYEDWMSRLPAGVEPAYDGLVIEIASASRRRTSTPGMTATVSTVSP
jgi:phosphoribosyl 1,2-cyclic phosphate phosphodiesterase